MVTGGGNGIGQATARQFAREGAKVLVVDIEPASAQATVRSITEAGGTAHAILCDVSDSESVRAMVEQTVARFGRIDVLFSNAAIQITKSAAETTEAEWDRLHAVNLKGAFLCARHVVPVMQRQKKGVIIITSSGHAFATYRNCSAYAATKGGQLAFMRGLALDYARDGIRVNCVIPGATDTRLVRNYIAESKDPEATRRGLLDSIPLGRLATPDDIAHAVLFLASDYAAYITGTSLAVDGGLLAGR
ncbi:MAG: SDR family oxidoreductase [Acidobacteria bacterium]|nr:SDR family oxidoreductase [Acidobacteriota bacterium]